MFFAASYTQILTPHTQRIPHFPHTQRIHSRQTLSQTVGLGRFQSESLTKKIDKMIANIATSPQYWATSYLNEHYLVEGAPRVGSGGRGARGERGEGRAWRRWGRFFPQGAAKTPRHLQEQLFARKMGVEPLLAVVEG